MHYIHYMCNMLELKAQDPTSSIVTLVHVMVTLVIMTLIVTLEMLLIMTTKHQMLIRPFLRRYIVESVVTLPSKHIMESCRRHSMISAMLELHIVSMNKRKSLLSSKDSRSKQLLLGISQPKTNGIIFL